MGGSKTKTTSNQATTATTTLPAWMTQAGQTNYDNAAGWMAANPTTSYTAPITAGSSANQAAASQMAASTAGTGQSDLDAARAYTAAAASAPAPTVNAQNQRVTNMGAAQQGVSTYSPTMQAGTGSVAADQVGTGTFNSAAAQQYMSPYTQAVQADTLATMGKQDASDQAALADSAQAAGAYGGTRQALEQSELAKNQALAKQNYIDSSNQAAYTNAQDQFNTDQSRALTAGTANQSADLSAGTTNANLLAQMIAANQGAANTASEFNAGAANTAAGANADRSQAASAQNATAANTASSANADRNLTAQTTNASNYQSMLDRLIQAAQSAGSIGTSASNLNTQQIGNLASTGATDQSTANAADEAAYQDYLRTQTQPLDEYNTLASILAGTPKNVTSTGTSNGTSTTSQSGGLLNTLLGAGSLAASLAPGVGSALGSVMIPGFSDRRLKRDIALVDRRADGLGLYRYRYVWDRDEDPERLGVMADEVAHIVPEALGPIAGGYATVDYSKVGAF